MTDFYIYSHQMAAKLTKNLGPPSSNLHVANLPEGLTHVEVKVSLLDLVWCNVGIRQVGIRLQVYTKVTEMYHN